MASREAKITTEDVVHYHLDQIRRFGKGWRAPEVRRHREAIIALIRLRRHLRKALARAMNEAFVGPQAHFHIDEEGKITQIVKTHVESDGSVIKYVTHI